MGRTPEGWRPVGEDNKDVKHNKEQIAPEGWKTKGGIRNLVNKMIGEGSSIADPTIARDIKDILDQHPDKNEEWAGEFESISLGKKTPYYHPDVVELVIQKFIQRKERMAPEGWKNINNIKTLLKESYRATSDYRTISNKIQTILEEHPDKKDEWVNETYFDSNSREGTTHYHPDLVVKIVESLKENIKKPAPEGWKTKAALLKELNKQIEGTKKFSQQIVESTVEEILEEHPDKKDEWSGEFSPSHGSNTMFYHPDLVKEAVERLKKRREGMAPLGWETSYGIIVLLKNELEQDVSNNTVVAEIQKILEEHPDKKEEWVGEFTSSGGRGAAVHYHPDLVSLALEKIKSSLKERVVKEELDLSDPVGVKNLLLTSKTEQELKEINYSNFASTVFSKGTPFERWGSSLLKNFGTKLSTYENMLALLRFAGIERDDFDISNPQSVRDLLLSSKTEEELRNIKLSVFFRTTFGQGSKFTTRWGGNLLKSFGSKLPNTENMLALLRFAGIERDDFEISNPQSVRDLLLSSKTEEELRNIGLNDFSTTNFGQSSKFPTRLGVGGALLKNFGSKLQNTENMLALLKFAGIDLKGRSHEQRGNEQFVREFIGEIQEGKTETAQAFRSLINIFGSSHCLDILYKFRPEFKGLPREYVNGVLADYLGDFLTIKTGFKPKDLETAVEFLSDVTFQDALYETIKDDCFRYYITERRSRRAEEGQAIIEGYLNHMVEQVGHLNNHDLDNIIQKVLLYYDSVLRDFHKPERFVGALSSEREFPDINQRINMKELADKKRLLIADEMGLGKSASVIMAKEQLGVKCALVVAPSNVLETWQRYLSEGSKGGYFKEGEAPRVLVVEDPTQAGQASTEDYDYILVSQERMTDRYADILKGMNFDMMIVDEVHKFKKPEGVRASYLTELTQKIQGENQYLALLSGTPVPNKIQDIGLILKLLYPEKFAGTDDRELVRNIVRGDVLDLRSLLLPRMQMKDLQEGVEMPELIETISQIELSDIEKRVYEVLLEDDELTAAGKMRLLRTFLLNPEVVDATPGIGGAKLEALSTKLDMVFETKDKVVVFVNDCIEGVVWGEGNITSKLGLTADVEVKVIYGDVTKPERKKIEEHLKTSNGKVLLIVSGQTADVGVDFSSADQVIMYNEPWTEYQKRQEVGRVYRPGLSHDLENDTLIVKETIEEGIHHHIQKKYKIVEKLLRGIPITELDKALVINDEQEKEPDISVNEELARYYFSSWDNLMRMFSYVKEIGEEDFRKFLEKYGKDYAGSYVDLGNRSYQSNANRITGTMIHEMAEQRKQSPKETRVLDLASGPEMLKRHIGDEYQRQVISIDINKEHFVGREGENRVVGSLNALPFKDGSFDYANASLSFHYTSLVPSKGKFERLQVLREMNRVLKPEGRVIINLIYSLDVKDKAKFAEAVQEFGFQSVEDYTGTIRSGSNYASQVITLEKIKDIDYETPIAKLAESLDKEKLNGLKFKQTAEKIKDPRRVVTSFELGGTTHEIKLNAQDQEIREEEQSVLTQGERLKETYKDIKFIPAQEIIDNNFMRIRIGKKYVLFKKLTKGAGVVIVK